MNDQTEKRCYLNDLLDDSIKTIKEEGIEPKGLDELVDKDCLKLNKAEVIALLKKSVLVVQSFNILLYKELKEKANGSRIRLEQLKANHEEFLEFQEFVKTIPTLARSENSRKGGKARVKNDPKTLILNVISNEAISRADKFKIRGYRKVFVEEMLSKYPELSDNKAIESRLVYLTRGGLISDWK